MAWRSAIRRIPLVDRAISAVRRTDYVRSLEEKVSTLHSAMTAGAQRYVTWVPPGHFYSPVPDHDDVERQAARLFQPRHELAGIDLRVRQQLDLFARLAEIAGDHPLADSAVEGRRYHTDNPNYGVGDAYMLQSMLLHLRPRRFVEVGSGWTTALVLDANELFLDGSLSVTAIEPCPQLLRERLLAGDRVDIVESAVQDAPLDLFTQLGRDDMLFIDCSHVVKVGSDAHYLVTQILPLLAEGVVVHVHDVFWPFEYPQQWVSEGRAWNEAYLLHAFLLFNSTFRIELFNSYLAACHGEEIERLLPAMSANPGGALWLSRVATSGG